MNNEKDMDFYAADDFDEQVDNQPRWFILGKDKKKFGKYTTKQMIDYYNQGKLNENSTVACTGMKSWTKFKDTELMQYINTFDENDFVAEDFGSEYKQSMHNDAKTTFEYPSNINTFAYAILVCIILAIVGTNKTLASLGLWGIATLGYLLFWYLDLQRLKRIVGFEKINGIWQIWGFLFIPVYLFIRDKKLDKKYKFGWLSIGAIVVGAIVASILSTPTTTSKQTISDTRSVKEDTEIDYNDTEIVDNMIENWKTTQSSEDGNNTSYLSGKEDDANFTTESVTTYSYTNTDIANAIDLGANYKDVSRNPNNYIGQSFYVTYKVSDIRNATFLGISTQEYMTGYVYDLEAKEQQRQEYLSNEYMSDWASDESILEMAALDYDRPVWLLNKRNKNDTNYVKVLKDDVIKAYGIFNGLQETSNALTSETGEIMALDLYYVELLNN